MAPTEEQVLFILAHQDDEIAAASRILFENAGGATVFCVFLTDGTARGSSASVRDAESLAVLTRLGVSPSRIVFVGSHAPIADGTLVEHLDQALRHLEEVMTGRDLARVYALAWEGGHHDHDASHLVAAAFAARRGMVDRCFELPLYRSSAFLPGFRVLSPAPPRRTWQRRRLALREGIRLALLVRHYRSQRRSWLGLFPGLFAKLVLLRRELIRPCDVTRLGARPDGRTPLYESRFHYPRERFYALARPFVSAHLSQ